MTLTLEDRLQENKSIARRSIELISERQVEDNRGRDRGAVSVETKSH